MTSRISLLLSTLLIALVAWTGPVLAEGDAKAGKKVFRKCAACHTVKAGKHRVGPSLAGVVGMTPGTMEGYKKYSKAMKKFGADGNVWDEATLDKFLTKPKKLIKKSKMAFAGLKKEKDRQNVIAYIKSASK